MKGRRHILLYDGDCPMCTFQSRLLGWLDWFGRVDFVPLGDPRAEGLAPGITREDLLEAIHCITPAGDVHRGARAIRFLGMRIPLLLPVGLFLWFPGVIFAAERIYAWVSRNRHLLSRVFGCRGACAVLPARRAEPEPRE